MDRQTDGRGASQMPDKKGQDDLTLSVEGTIIDVSEYEKARMCICRENPGASKFNDAGSTVFQKV